MFLKMFQVDAFSDRIFGGNPATVLVLDEWLPDSLMQAILRRLILNRSAAC